MNPQAKLKLKEIFGFDTLKPGQEQVMESLLAGKSSAAVFPTGGGKSLCYQLPALMLSGVSLVVSPLIALMKDQIDFLKSKNVLAARLDSSLSREEYFEVMDHLRSGSLKLLYVAPERFNNERFRESLSGIPISMFAVDEAHCISEWGHNFRPDYLKLALYAKEFDAERILALTATATLKVLDDICRQFGIEKECAVRTDFFRSNLIIKTSPTERDSRDKELLGLLEERTSGPTIVYVTLQRTSEEVAEMLSSSGLPAKAYHAGMKDDEREAVQNWFMSPRGGIVVATIAFGMGIDKADIRYIYHYNLPKSLENYAQEIGRAGRDDDNSTCHTLACIDDLNVLENFIYGDTPTEESIYSLLKYIFTREERFAVSIYTLSRDHDIRKLVVKTILTDLELRGYLQGGTPFYESYKLNFLLPRKEILGKFDEGRTRFLSNLFDEGTMGSKWLQIDADKAATAINSPRDRIIKALNYLEEKGMIELGYRGAMNRYTRLRSLDDVATLAAELHVQALGQERREVDRLGDVLDFVQNDGCQAAALSLHFGETLPAPCGVCSWCSSDGNPIVLEKRSHPEISESKLQETMGMRENYTDALGNPRAFTRWLCGITSPKITAEKINKNRLFGCFSKIPFHRVLERVK